MRQLKHFGFANFSFSILERKAIWVLIEEYTDGEKHCYNLDGSFYGSLSKNNINDIIEEI